MKGHNAQGVDTSRWANVIWRSHQSGLEHSRRQS